MTITELNESIPTLWELIYSYASSFYILLPITVAILLMSMMLLSDREKFTEFWFDYTFVIAIILILNLASVATFAVFSANVFKDWKSTNYEKYVNSLETKTMDNDRVLETGVVSQSDKIEVVFVDDEGKRVHKKVDVRYDTELDEVVLTYKQLEQDIHYRNKEVIGVKGENISYILTLPLHHKKEQP